MADMRMRPDLASGYPGCTCRFYKGKAMFEFGYGLSHSNYSYAFTSVTQNQLYLNKSATIQTVEEDSNSIRFVSVAEMGDDVCQKMTFSAAVEVKNHGEMAGKHSVLLFIRQAKPRHGNPVKRLVGFQSLHLNAGERAEIEFILKPCEHRSKAYQDGLSVTEEGSHFLIVGDREFPVTVVF
uniref:Fibronectin type III-like domain-containing protein n=2 Tax=Nelumbo nucifera TaxID=4432 RepID=A0A822Z1K4_NELNU|nr:TPA_asm: hypothetical protein HUJ06_014617 [Nelumbo nucifera]